MGKLYNQVNCWFFKYFENILLACIVILGTALRSYHFFGLTFTFDELSAMSRLHFSSFGELIEKGVRIDAHPAGIQVFLYYWTRLFGDKEWVVKFPFLVMGIGCIPFIFYITKDWFGTASAFIAAAFISTMQFAVTYSTIARPYIAGAFFSLLMVFFWTRYLFKTKKNGDLAGFIFSASFCAYIHHFSLLFAVIVGLTGFFFIDKSTWKKYLFSGLLTFLTYAPHLGIFFYQLHIGGNGGPGGWLGPPENNFLLRFIEYIFHYSWLTAGTAFLIISFYLITGFNKKDESNKFRIICMVWFFLPFLIGFYYSKRINPILQFSLLIFSFPYIILWISSYVRESNKLVILLLVLVISGVDTYSLVFSRKHYEIIPQQSSDEYAKSIVKVQRSFPGKKIFSILSRTEIPFMEYYKKKYHVNFDYVVFDSQADDPKGYWYILKNKNPDYLLIGNLAGQYSSFFTEEYPERVYHATGINAINCYGKSTEVFKEIEKPLVEKTIPANFRILDSLQEWGPGFKAGLKETVKVKNAEVTASVRIKGINVFKDNLLVLQINKGDSLIHWQAGNLTDFFRKEEEWQTIYTSCRIQDILKPGQKMDDYTISIFFWNKGRQKTMIDAIKIKTIESNPLYYGLFDNFQDD